MNGSFEQRLAVAYPDMSGALRQAADFLMTNPLDVVTRPLRTVARSSQVSPSAYSRLARALGYESFDELREELREKIDLRVNNFAARAEVLQSRQFDSRVRFADAHMAACQGNLTEFAARLNHDDLDVAVERLTKARRVLLLGALGSTGVVEYLSYMANFAADNWMLASRMGASLGAGMAGMDERDVLLIVSKPPFATNVMKAARLARQMGVYVIVITDNHACPALEFASVNFMVPADSPHFYSSYVVTLYLVETIIGMVVARAGAESQTRIAEVELRNRQLSEVWTD